MLRFRTTAIVVLLATLLGGCASLPENDYRSQYLNGQPEAALATLDTSAYKGSRNELLRLMEKGSLLHDVGDYAASSKVLLKATKLMDELDYVSVADESKAMLANDWAARYRGEYAERLWVHTYQMMNFLLLGQPSGAAVEARQALALMEKYSDALDDDLFTRALIALSFETVGKPNDAWIEYQKLAKKLDDPSPIAAQLVRLGKLLGFSDKVREYRQYLPAGQSSSQGRELIVFVANGIIPEKYASSIFVEPDIRISFPAYNNNRSPAPVISLSADNAGATESLPANIVTSNLARIARESLDDRGAKVLAKAVARASVKHSLARELKKENEAAGQLLSAVFWLLEQADTRSWRTLPAYLSLVRSPLPDSAQSVQLNINGRSETIDLSDTGAGAAIAGKIYRRMRTAP